MIRNKTIVNKNKVKDIKETKKIEYDNTSMEIYLKKRKKSNRSKKAYEQSISYFISNESNRHNSLYVEDTKDNKISNTLSNGLISDEVINEEEIGEEEIISDYYICYNKTAIEILLYDIYNHSYIIKDDVIATIVFYVDFNKYINVLKNEDKTIIVEAYGLFDGIQKDKYELKKILDISVGNKLDKCLKILRDNIGFNKLYKYFK